ncbi:MAG: 3-phosphoshikimate 1-carboxyvinyltransferase [Thermoplasmata archaeon]|nr:3-phosphoshikimate 1-carboxyvinyltransferase [Thermoplasmata archaeon]
MSERVVRPGPVSGRIRAPPSKSYTHRGAVIGHLTGVPFELVNPLESGDTRATRDGLEALGTSILRRERRWVFRPNHRPRPPRFRTVRCASSGTTLRFLLSVAALDTVPVRFVGNPDLGRRPVEPLLRALERRGARCRRPGGRRSLPVTVEGVLRPGDFEVSGEESSQFLSSLLLVTPALPSSSRIRLTSPLVSRPYVEATLAALRRQGVEVRAGDDEWEVRAPGGFRRRSFEVTGDASSAAYLWASAAVAGGTIEVAGVDPRWPQADLAVLELLERAGATVRSGARGVRVVGAGLNPFEFDFTACPDLLPLGGVLAALARGGASVLGGAPHATLKESDRHAGTEALARALGARTRRWRQGLAVVPSALPRSLRAPASSDHRIVMASAVAALGLGAPSRIRNVEAVRKSFPGFWDALRSLGGKVGN